MRIAALNKNTASRTAGLKNKQLKFGVNYSKFILQTDKTPKQALDFAFNIRNLIKKNNLGDVVLSVCPWKNFVEMNVESLYLKAIIELLEGIANTNKVHIGIVINKST